MIEESGLPAELTPLELRLMRAVWDLERAGKPTSSRQIYDRFCAANDDRRLAFTTISTYLKRLIEKGVLRRDENKPREYRYVPIVSREDFREQLISKCLGLFESEHEMIGRFLRRAKLRPAERKQLEQIVARLRRSSEESGRNE
jgi:predicted transcriptional regulator